MILFSIVIPAYKAAFLKECIDSILRQTYVSFELIVLNDSSPEDINGIVQQYSDTRIRYYENDVNCGAFNIVDNWNKLLDLAKGEFIICLGDDDKLLPICLAEYAQLINRYPNLDAFHAWTELIDENGDFYGLQERRPEYESVYSLIWHRWNGRIQFIGDFCFRTAKLKSVGGYYKLPLAWASDDITGFLVAKENGIANSQMPLFQYRVNSQTISNTGNVVDKLSALDLEYNWYTSFFKDSAANPLDAKYKLLLDRQFSFYFNKKKVLLIKADLSSSPFKKIGFWFKMVRKGKITSLMLAKAFTDSLAVYYKKTTKK